LVDSKKKEGQNNNCWDLTEEALDAKSFLVKYVDFDPVEDKFMAMSLNYRGVEMKSIGNGNGKEIVNQTLLRIQDQDITPFEDFSQPARIVDTTTEDCKYPRSDGVPEPFRSPTAVPTQAPIVGTLNPTLSSTSPATQKPTTIPDTSHPLIAPYTQRKFSLTCNVFFF